MCRALFIFAKLNPGLTYVQGMNELYAPLYYLCAHDAGADDGEHAGDCVCSLTRRDVNETCLPAACIFMQTRFVCASLRCGCSTDGLPATAEADAWYCFVDLISDFRDHFCKQLVCALSKYE